MAMSISMLLLFFIVCVGILMVVGKTIFVLLHRKHEKNYFRNLMRVGEDIIHEGKTHWFAILLTIAMCMILIIVGIELSIELETEIYFVGCLITVLALICIAIIRKYSTKLGFSNKRVLGEYGVFKTYTIDIPLNKVNNVSISKGVFGSIFGYGNVHIISSSVAHKFKNIAEPEIFRINLLKQIDLYGYKDISVHERQKRYCVYCGKEINEYESIKYCPGCGKQL